MGYLEAVLLVVAVAAWQAGAAVLRMVRPDLGTDDESEM